MRPDFIDLTFCSICIYGVIMKAQIHRKAYRVAVVGIALSFLFDFFYLVVYSEYYWFRARGWDYELYVRRFVLILNYVKIIVKFIFFFLLWKVCIDFEETVRYKGSDQYKNKIKQGEKDKHELENQYYGGFVDSDLGDGDMHIYDQQ